MGRGDSVVDLAIAQTRVQRDRRWIIDRLGEVGPGVVSLERGAGESNRRVIAVDTEPGCVARFFGADSVRRWRGAADDETAVGVTWTPAVEVARGYANIRSIQLGKPAVVLSVLVPVSAVRLVIVWSPQTEVLIDPLQHEIERTSICDEWRAPVRWGRPEAFGGRPDRRPLAKSLGFRADAAGAGRLTLDDLIREFA